MGATVPATLLLLLLLLLALGVSAKPTAKLTDECGARPADVVFVLDVSSSIWPKHFRLHVLTFVQEVRESLSIFHKVLQNKGLSKSLSLVYKLVLTYT